MDESLESKPQYLREQILDKGYDPNQFFTFLLSKRNEEEANLETWSFPDLQNVVNEFIMLHNLLRRLALCACSQIRRDR